MTLMLLAIQEQMKLRTQANTIDVLESIRYNDEIKVRHAIRTET